MSVVNCVASQEGRRIGDVDLATACPAETEGCFVWIGLHEPDKNLLRTVQQRFGLHDLAIEDALVAHQRPKLELYGGGVFIALRTAQLVDGKVRFGETLNDDCFRTLRNVSHDQLLCSSPASLSQSALFSPISLVSQ